MRARAESHHILDELSDDEIVTAKRFLQYLRDLGADPLLRKLDSATLDDEPVYPQEEGAVQEALDAVAHGDVISDAELRIQLGL